MENIFDKISGQFNYNDLKKFKDISYYSALGLSWGTLLTPWQVDLAIFPIEVILFVLCWNLKSFKAKNVANIREIYSEVISDYGNMLKSLELKDPVEISAFFEICYRTGYLSRDKKFVFGDGKARDISSIFGCNVINGEGVCRHISYMLDDVYKNVGINSDLLFVYLRKRNVVPRLCLDEKGLTREELYELVDLSTFNSKERERVKKAVDDIIDIVGEHLKLDVEFEKIKGRPRPNHVVNLVVHDNKSFFIDPTNFCSYKINREDPNFLLDRFDPKIMVDWFSYGNINKSFKEIRHVKESVLLPSTSLEEDMEKKKKIQTFYEENIDIVDYFYRKHNEAYRDISNEMMKIKVKEKKKK